MARTSRVIFQSGGYGTKNGTRGLHAQCCERRDSMDIALVPGE
jgi:hypothetical protein